MKNKMVKEEVFTEMKIDDLQVLLHFRLVNSNDALALLQSQSESENKRVLDISPDLVSLVFRYKEKN